MPLPERPDWSRLAVGDALAPASYGPITRAALALFAGGSGDHNPIHIDIDFARASGLDDVIAHGMFSMAYMGRYLDALAGPGAIETWSIRFQAMTPPGAIVSCSAKVTEIDLAAGRCRLSLAAHIDGGVRTLAGEAVVRIAGERAA